MGGVLTGQDGRQYVKKRGTSLYLPVTDNKGNVLIMKASEVLSTPHPIEHTLESCNTT